MNEPFWYLSSRHPRSADPGPYRSNSAYKPHLRREFGGKCVYCCMPDGIKGEETYGVDHYLPERWFPELKNTWSNLFYACNRCNSLKRDVRPEPDCFIPNPCDHTMSEHMQFSGSDIKAYTLAGQFTVKLLGLGEWKLRSYRISILRLISLLKQERDRLLDLLDQAARMTPEALAETRDDLREIEEALRRFTGA